METLRLLSKDETFDPGVNLDSCGEDSDSEALNNDRLPSCSASSPDKLDTVHNDLSSCQCMGVKCICDSPALSCAPGGPDADNGGCQGHNSQNMQEAHRKKCKGTETKSFYSVDAGVFEGCKGHKNLCSYCANGCPYCPFCGPMAQRKQGMKGKKQQT